MNLQKLIRIASIAKWAMLVIVVWYILFKVAPAMTDGRIIRWMYVVTALLVVVTVAVDICEWLYDRSDRHRGKAENLQGRYDYEQREAHEKAASRLRMWAFAAIAILLIGLILLKVLSSGPY